VLVELYGKCALRTLGELVRYYNSREVCNYNSRGSCVILELYGKLCNIRTLWDRCVLIELYGKWQISGSNTVVALGLLGLFGQ
jgi:hypothetical protein